MIIVPPGPAITDHGIPATFSWARVHREMSCLVLISVITVSLLPAERGYALYSHEDW
jgi:hypothetical protein